MWLSDLSQQAALVHGEHEYYHRHSAHQYTDSQSTSVDERYVHTLRAGSEERPTVHTALVSADELRAIRAVAVINHCASVDELHGDGRRRRQDGRHSHFGAVSALASHPSGNWTAPTMAGTGSAAVAETVLRGGPERSVQLKDGSHWSLPSAATRSPPGWWKSTDADQSSWSWRARLASHGSSRHRWARETEAAEAAAETRRE